MTAEADLAYRQALALCPYNRAAIDSYLVLLAQQRRWNEAAVFADSAANFLGENPDFRSWHKAWRQWLTAQSSPESTERK